jgi:hypothetical protein
MSGKINDESEANALEKRGDEPCGVFNETTFRGKRFLSQLLGNVKNYTRPP